MGLWSLRVGLWSLRVGFYRFFVQAPIKAGNIKRKKPSSRRKKKVFNGKERFYKRGSLFKFFQSLMKYRF